jgi:hypothetical protein
MTREVSRRVPNHRNPGIRFPRGRFVMAIEELPAEDLVYEIEPEVQEDLLKHPGKWAALTRSALLAVADSPEDALARARKLGYQSPILYWIPDRATSFFF